MTNWNFLRTAPTRPHIPIDEAASPPVEASLSLVMPSQSEASAVHEALRDSERHFQLLVQAVKDYAIFMLDPQGRITTWNSGAERIKGYRAEEIVGEHFSRFYTQEDQREGLPMRSLQRAATEGRRSRASRHSRVSACGPRDIRTRSSTSMANLRALREPS